MTEEGVHKIGVLSTLSHHCASRIDALSVHLSENSVENFDNFIEGCENLDQGEIDLFVAPSNLIWDEREILATKGLSIVAALQRNHPFHVLVSSDDPWHLKADAIVLCDEKIIERQLLRRRGKIPRRLDIRNYSEFDLDSNSSDDLRTAQQMINEGKIDAFIIPRGSYSLAGLNERRHAMLPDAEEMAGMRFVPAPFVDLMLVLSRQGFHPHVIQSWTDNEAKNAWLTTKAILERTPKELHNRIGIHYRQRNVGPILEEAERVKDLFVLETLHDPEGEVDDLLRYEIIVETINEDGTMTTGIERVGPVDKLYVDIHFMMNDWNSILERMSLTEEE